jgi:hypothetical protein
MGLTVDLDRNPTFKAGEVGDVAVARKLAAESESVRPFAQLLPQDNFRQSQLAAKLASAADILVRRAHCSMPDAPLGPSTIPLRCMVPLPVPGRI